MIVKAYVLASFTDWLESSVRSYYDYVDELIVTWDERHLSYSGLPLDVDKCLDILRKIDVKNKMTWCPGDYSNSTRTPFENETFQRQSAIEACSNNADWILQIDTDELVLSPARLSECLKAAAEYEAVDFPARFLFRQLSQTRYLEVCSRFWGPVANYPGAVAVRPHTKLKHARQCDAKKKFRVDFRSSNTDPWQARGVVVHKVIDEEEGVLHFAWIRSESAMIEKSKFSNHSSDKVWSRELRRWFWSAEHPMLTTLGTPFFKTETGCYPKGLSNHLRISEINLPSNIPLDDCVRHLVR